MGTANNKYDIEIMKEGKLKRMTIERSNAGMK